MKAFRRPAVLLFALLFLLCSCRGGSPADSAQSNLNSAQPNFNSAQSNLDPGLLKWASDLSGPLYLPLDWAPIQAAAEKDTAYFLRGFETEDGIQIEAYRAHQKAEFNDSDVPMSEADFLGSVTRTQAVSADGNTPPYPSDGFEEFSLTEDISAYRSEDGCIIKWEEDGWRFSARYDVSPGDFHELLEFVKAWNERERTADEASSGDVTILITKKTTVSFQWTQGDFKYDFTTINSDFSNAIRSFLSFSQIKD